MSTARGLNKCSLNIVIIALVLSPTLGRGQRPRTSLTMFLVSMSQGPLS